MPCDLRFTFGVLARSLPEDPAQQTRAVQIAPSEFAPVPECMRSDQICATRDLHYYGDVPVDALSIELDAPTCRHLGLWILASALHPEPRVMSLELLHPRSTIKRIHMRPDAPHPFVSDGTTMPPFNYRARHPARYPWLGAGIAARDMAVLTATTGIPSREDAMARDTLVGFGPASGVRMLATLFLDAGLPTNPNREYKLEGKHGHGGVGPGSDELSIWLPGSLGHLDTPMAG